LDNLLGKNRPIIIPKMEKFDGDIHEEFLQNNNLLMDEIPNLCQAFLGLGADGYIASLSSGESKHFA